MLNPFLDFLSSPARNNWLIHGNVEVYLRKSPHYIGDSRFEFLDIANVIPRHHLTASNRSGEFKRLLATCEILVLETFNLAGIYVENVSHPHLPAFLLREGFIKIPGWQDLGPPSFYKILK